MHSSVNKNESRTFSAILIRWALFFTEMGALLVYGIRPLLILFMAATVYDGGMGWRERTPRRSLGFLPAVCIWPRCRAAGWRITGWPTTRRLVRLYPDRHRHLSIALSAWLGNDLFFIGLMFIVTGSGLFKTCISVMVGTLYKKGDARATVVFRCFTWGSTSARLSRH